MGQLLRRHKRRYYLHQHPERRHAGRDDASVATNRRSQRDDQALMQLVPIPATDEYINATFPHWSQFLPDIAKRSKETIAELLAMVAHKQVQPILVWDETQNKYVALVGIRYHKRGDDWIAEGVWMAGRGYMQWRGLLPELEKYLKHVGVYELRPINRLGYYRFLRDHGYKPTHMIMAKVL